MDARIRVGLLITVLGVSGTVAPGRLAAQDSLPAGVTREMVDRGKKVFTGPGMCFACHGMEGKGAVGPNLTDTLWIHSRGEYARIVEVIRAGVTGRQSRSGIIMPPKGGSAISDADASAAAAYVWSLSRRTVLSP